MTWLLGRSAPRIIGLLLGLFSAFPADAGSRYIRQTSGAESVIVFVHGILGDGDSTWTDGKAYWPELLKSDPTFNSSDIFVYSYPTTFWASLSIDELAENIRLQLDVDHVSDHRRIIFLTHSMGGLVTRVFLLNNRKVAERTLFAYFFSTPTGGAEVASIATLISRNPQFNKMKPMNAVDSVPIRNWFSAGRFLSGAR